MEKIVLQKTPLRVLVAVLLLLGLTWGSWHIASVSHASTPASGSVDAANPTTSWSFAPVAGANVGVTPIVTNCVATFCDNFDLTVAAPPTGMQGVLTVDLTWNNTTAGGTDLDLFVVAPDGTTSGPGSPDDMPTGAGKEELKLAATKSGTYHIRSVAGTAPTPTPAQGTATIAYTPIPPTTTGGSITSTLQFAPSSLVSANLLGAEPQLNIERGVANSPAGRINPNYAFIDWPFSSRTQSDILQRTTNGGDTWRQILDFRCSERNAPGCASGGGGDSVNRVNQYDGNVYFGEQEVVAQEALSSSTDLGDTFQPTRQQPISNTATAVDRQWISTVDAPNIQVTPLATLGQPTPLPVTLDAFYSYHIPAAGEYIQGVTTAGQVLPQPNPQIAIVSQSGPSRVDVNPKSLGNGYFYQCYRDGNGFEVATAKISDYQLNTAYSIHNVSKDQPAIFPWINLDNQGNLYATWVTGGVVKYRYSQIGLPTNNPAMGGIPGTTWSDTYVVNPSALGSNVFPEVVAGDPGHVAIVYDGTTDYTGPSDTAPSTARWQPYVSIATDPLGNAPAFQTGAVSHRVVHVGSICTSGTTCTGDRSLLDLIDIQMDTSGRVGVVYTDNNDQFGRDTGSSTSRGQPFVHFAKITQGPSLLGSSTVNLSIPTNSRAADPGDSATWPNVVSTPSTDLKSLDERSAAVTVNNGQLVGTINLLDASSATMQNDITSFNSAMQNGVSYSTANPAAAATRLLYILRFETGFVDAMHQGDVYYLAYEASAGGATRAFGAKLDGTNATAKSSNAISYTSKTGTAAVPTTGTVSGNTLTLSAALSSLGLSASDTIYSVTAFAYAGPSEAIESMQDPASNGATIGRIVDATPPFDATLLSSSPTIARVASFHVQHHSSIVNLTWHLAQSRGIVGFNLDAGTHRLNHQLIPVHHSPTYHFSAHYRGTGPYVLRIVMKDGAIQSVTPH